MIDADSQLMRLQDLQHFLAGGSLEDGLQRQVSLTAALVRADTCSVMLLSGGSGADPRLTVCASHGALAAQALHASIGKGEGICGRVLAGGRSLLVEDIGRSEFALLARRPEAAGRSLMSSPIRIEGKIVGVLNAASRPGVTFCHADLMLLDVIALFIGKSVQVSQLQAILNSRFMQLALVREAPRAAAGVAYRNPDEVARILAKSFFREMTSAGFGEGQIVQAASEIIGLLGRSVQRHSKRLARK
jgi:signal transduction protein with GAF and PtsI domain